LSVDYISPAELQAKADGGQTMAIIDLRPQEDFRKNHIQGAINIPFEELQNSLNQIPRNHEVILVCYHGASSVSAAEFLDSRGYQNLAVLEGGMEGWEGQG